MRPLGYEPSELPLLHPGSKFRLSHQGTAGRTCLSAHSYSVWRKEPESKVAWCRAKSIGFGIQRRKPCATQAIVFEYNKAGVSSVGSRNPSSVYLGLTNSSHCLPATLHMLYPNTMYQYSARGGICPHDPLQVRGLAS